MTKEVYYRDTSFVLHTSLNDVCDKFSLAVLDLVRGQFIAQKNYLKIIHLEDIKNSDMLHNVHGVGCVVPTHRQPIRIILSKQKGKDLAID